MTNNFISLQISYEFLFKIIILLITFLFIIVLFEFYCFHTVYSVILEKLLTEQNKQLVSDQNIEILKKSSEQILSQSFFDENNSFTTPGIKEIIVLKCFVLVGLTTASLILGGVIKPDIFFEFPSQLGKFFISLF